MPLEFDISSQTFWLLIAYSAAVILASVLGGLLPEWIRLTHNRMQLMISFVGGVMLGIAVFHMIPHALAVLPRGSNDQVAWGLMLGLLATFFLLRFSHFHQHGPADFGIAADELQRQTSLAAATASDVGLPQRTAADKSPPTHLCSEHNHPAAHATHQDCGGSESSGNTRWMAVLVGLGVHTLMDGVAMASGVAADVTHGHAAVLPGLGIFLAVLLHKPLDAVSITSLMHPVTTPAKRLLVNVGFALMCPVGAFLFLAGTGLGSGWTITLAGWGLAFSAGVFLCISLSDLLPEMEFHSHNRFQLTGALLLGIAAAWAIGLAEGEHAHGHAPLPSSSSPADVDDHDHDHDGHQH